VSGSGISWAICKSAPHPRQITTPAPHHSVFTGWMPFLPPNQQHQSTEPVSSNLPSVYNWMQEHETATFMVHYIWSNKWCHSENMEAKQVIWHFATSSDLEITVCTRSFSVIDNSAMQQWSAVTMFSISCHSHAYYNINACHPKQSSSSVIQQLK